MNDDAASRPPRPARKPVRKATPAGLMRAALAYLERFSASTDGVRQVLRRKVRRSLADHGGDPAELAAWIEDVLADLRRQGWLNDRAFAEAHARSLAARGTAGRLIRQKLAGKGVSADDAEAALSRLAEEVEAAPFGEDVPEPPAPDLAAAVAYARRRRLGPWRLEDQRAERRERDLAALARRGFSYDIALAVIDAEDTADLEARAGRL